MNPTKFTREQAKTLASQIGRRQRELDLARHPHPLITARDEYAAQYGYSSGRDLNAALVPLLRRSHRGSDNHTDDADGGASAAKLPLSDNTMRYLAICRGNGKKKREYIPSDTFMAEELGVSRKRVGQIRKEIKLFYGYTFEYDKATQGWWAQAAPVPISELAATNGKEMEPSFASATNGLDAAQLPLPAEESASDAPAVEPVATTVTGTLEEVPGVALVVTETDLSVVVKKLAHIEALLDSLPSIVVLLTDLYVQAGRHHEASSSEQRQLRALVAQLLQKWN